MGKHGPLQQSADTAKLKGAFRPSRYRSKPHRSPAGQMPEPPLWFSEAQRAIWRDTVARAQDGMLAPGNYDNVVVLVVAVDRHRTLAARAMELTTAGVEIPTQLEQQLRLGGVEVGRASTLLGFPPAARFRLVSLPTEGEPEEWAKLFALRKPANG